MYTGTNDTGDITAVVLILQLSVLAHILDLIIRVERMPAVWDHEYWALLTNASFTLSFLPLLVLPVLSSSQDIVMSTLSQLESNFLSLVQSQFGVFYLAATFWKLNASFLNTETSCGTILILELLVTYTPPSLVAIMDWTTVAKAAPYLTLLVELILGLGMLYIPWAKKRHNTNPSAATVTRDRWIRNMTVVKATAFHILIFMMPVNSAGGFSLECLSRFIWFFDSEEVEAAMVSANCATYWIRATMISLGMIALRQVATEAPFDVGFFFAGLLGVFYSTLVVKASSTTTTPVHISTTAKSTHNNGAQSAGTNNGNGVTSSTKQPSSSPSRTTYSRLVMSFMMILSILYAFVGPILGIQQMGAPTMYANLRSYNGGNHYLVPTAILGENLLYGGGLVKVIESNSTAINLLVGYMDARVAFPSQVVNVLQPLIRHNNTATTTTTNATATTTPLQIFPMCLFNPHSRNVLMDLYLQSSYNQNPPQLFVPFLYPISGFRKTLEQAMKNQNEVFQIKVQVVQDNNNNGDDSVIIRLTSDGTCEILMMVGNYNKTTKPCNDDNQIARMLLQPYSKERSLWQMLLDKILTPYPELVGFRDEICMA
ncbi:expressed unknown protein [Seminavis robusta]|uniref:Uncharacterized protein n=1 Tax=Seminavis robusta TaxID=568900 RepID=A0A9N8EIB4_9STRA|nr:expressed unknown protein [Seminavis robusta]|eukprot:Sro1214_g253030.1 n/a (599) ;mRNA; r:11957-13753